MFTDSYLHDIEMALGKCHPDPTAHLHERKQFICDEIKALRARKVSPDEELIVWFADFMNRKGLRLYETNEITGRPRLCDRYSFFSSAGLNTLIQDFITWYDGYVAERKKARRTLRATLAEAVRLLRVHSNPRSGPLNPLPAQKFLSQYDERQQERGS